MINEETLTLYYYDDGLSAGERRAVAIALGDDAELAARYAALCRQLEQWREPDATKAPSHVVQRWHDSIDRAARAERVEPKKSGGPVHFMSFFWGAAITAALAIGVGIGVYFSADGSFDPPVDDLRVSVSADESMSIPASFTRGLQVYLQDSQSEIVGLSLDAGADRSLLVMQIIEQNRLFERTATMNNSPELARVLRAFEPILMRLASEDISPEDAAALRAQLAFELNVVLTKLARDTSYEAQTI
ncbi:MAG: hypothetical protein DRQ63_00515 [Gammaproteobacteria bacterium]|nr:MAG: hypothetical protein DRQ63_00515 [Gammaproteobacteria bacterium]